MPRLRPVLQFDAVGLTQSLSRNRRGLLRLGAYVAAGASPWPRAVAKHPGTEPDNRRVLESRQSPFGRLDVFEIGRRRYLGHAEGGPHGWLVYQSALDLDRPDHLLVAYTRLMMLGLLYAPAPLRVLQIGVGAGMMTRYLIRHYPFAEVDAVELDPNAIALGQRHFGLAPHPRLRIHVADGSNWLRETDQRFSIVMLDAYDANTIPPALREEAFFRLVAARLTPHGVVMQNVFAPQVDLSALLATVATSFEQIDAYAVRQSVVLAAYQGRPRSLVALKEAAVKVDTLAPAPHPLQSLLAFRTAYRNGDPSTLIAPKPNLEKKP